jgi:hypothetical protein
LPRQASLLLVTLRERPGAPVSSAANKNHTGVARNDIYKYFLYYY